MGYNHLLAAGFMLQIVVTNIDVTSLVRMWPDNRMLIKEVNEILYIACKTNVEIFLLQQNGNKSCILLFYLAAYPTYVYF